MLDAIDEDLILYTLFTTFPLFLEWNKFLFKFLPSDIVRHYIINEFYGLTLDLLLFLTFRYLLSKMLKTKEANTSPTSLAKYTTDAACPLSKRKSEKFVEFSAAERS